VKTLSLPLKNKRMMDLQTRKYQVIKELFKVESEQVIEIMENILNVQNENKIALPAWQKDILDERLKELEANPENLLDWDTIKEKW